MLARYPQLAIPRDLWMLTPRPDGCTDRYATFIRNMETAVGFVCWLHLERKRLMRKHGSYHMDADQYAMEILFANEEIRDAVCLPEDIKHYETCVDMAEHLPADIHQHYTAVPNFGEPVLLPVRAMPNTNMDGGVQQRRRIELPVLQALKRARR